MRYSIKVKFNKDFIREENGSILIGIKARPEKGKANQEIIKKLSRYFKVPISSINPAFDQETFKGWVKIISGKTSKIKVVEIP